MKEYFLLNSKISYNLNWAKENQIIDELNRLLELLFLFDKEKDNVIHFVDEKARKNSHYYIIIKVFDKPDDFFRYFDIMKTVDKDVLIEIIPHNYLLNWQSYIWNKHKRIYE